MRTLSSFCGRMQRSVTYTVSTFCHNTFDQNVAQWNLLFAEMIHCSQQKKKIRHLSDVNQNKVKNVQVWALNHCNFILCYKYFSSFQQPIFWSYKSLHEADRSALHLCANQQLKVYFKPHAPITDVQRGQQKGGWLLALPSSTLVSGEITLSWEHCSCVPAAAWPHWTLVRVPSGGDTNLICGRLEFQRRECSKKKNSKKRNCMLSR